MPEQLWTRGDSVASMLVEIQRMILTLRDHHGISCAILGKDVRLVAFERMETSDATDAEAKEEEGMEEETKAADEPEQLSHTRSGCRFPHLGSLVGHEHSDVILKIKHQDSGAASYLYASSEGLCQHSAFFKALFEHKFIESQSRVVELHVPCVEMLEATLAYLYTGEAPLPHGAHESRLGPDQLFGLLANATYLQIDGLVQHCADVLGRIVKTGEHEDYIRHPAFGPDLLPLRYLLNLLDGVGGQDDGTATADLRERLLCSAFAWLEGLEENALFLTVPPLELGQLSTKAGALAFGLPFTTLAALEESHPQGFQRLLRLSSFVPQAVALEKTVAEQARLLQVQRCGKCRALVSYGLREQRDCQAHFHPGPFIDGQPPFDGAWSCCHRAGLAAHGCTTSSTQHQLDPDAWVDFGHD